jgi:hypothetical protein
MAARKKYLGCPHCGSPERLYAVGTISYHQAVIVEDIDGEPIITSHSKITADGSEFANFCGWECGYCEREFESTAELKPASR